MQKFIFVCISLVLFSCNAMEFEHLAVKGKFNGELDLSAISCLNPSLCLVASDETNSLQFASIEDKAIIAHNQMIKLGEFKRENDIEGLTNDGKYFYAIGSHALSRKKGKFHAERFLLFKILINPDKTLQSLKSVSLEELIKKDSVLSKFLYKKTQNAGVNIEGLAHNDGKLFVGFRSPVINAHAQILEFPLSIFDKVEGKANLHSLKLGKNTGIRSLEFFNNKLIILAGADDREDVKVNAQIFEADLNSRSILNQSLLPYKTKKAEGLEIFEGNRVILYDSELSGQPILIKNN